MQKINCVYTQWQTKERKIAAVEPPHGNISIQLFTVATPLMSRRCRFKARAISFLVLNGVRVYYSNMHC